MAFIVIFCLLTNLEEKQGCRNVKREKILCLNLFLVGVKWRISKVELDKHPFPYPLPLDVFMCFFYIKFKLVKTHRVALYMFCKLISHKRMLSLSVAFHHWKKKLLPIFYINIGLYYVNYTIHSLVVKFLLVKKYKAKHS